MDERQARRLADARRRQVVPPPIPPGMLPPFMDGACPPPVSLPFIQRARAARREALPPLGMRGPAADMARAFLDRFLGPKPSATAVQEVRDIIDASGGPTDDVLEDLESQGVPLDVIRAAVKAVVRPSRADIRRAIEMYGATDAVLGDLEAAGASLDDIGAVIHEGERLRPGSPRFQGPTEPPLTPEEETPLTPAQRYRLEQFERFMGGNTRLSPDTLDKVLRDFRARLVGATRLEPGAPRFQGPQRPAGSEWYVGGENPSGTWRPSKPPGPLAWIWNGSYWANVVGPDHRAMTAAEWEAFQRAHPAGFPAPREKSPLPGGTRRVVHPPEPGYPAGWIEYVNPDGSPAGGVLSRAMGPVEQTTDPYGRNYVGPGGKFYPWGMPPPGPVERAAVKHLLDRMTAPPSRPRGVSDRAYYDPTNQAWYEPGQGPRGGTGATGTVGAAGAAEPYSNPPHPGAGYSDPENRAWLLRLSKEVQRRRPAATFDQALEDEIERRKGTPSKGAYAGRKPMGK